MSRVVHGAGADTQDHDLAAAPSRDLLCRRFVGGEVDVRPPAAREAFFAYRLEESGHCSMKKYFGRRARRELQVDGDGVALVRPDARAVGREREALLVARAHDLLEAVLVEGDAARGEPREERAHVGPAVRIERDAELLWFVPQREAEQLRDADAFHPSAMYAALMDTATVDEVTCAIDAAAAERPGGAIAFDGDGTLWSGDIGEDFFAAALERGPNEVTREPLLREAAAGLEIPPASGPREVAHAIHAAYLAGKFPEERVCEIVAWIAAGWTHDDLRAFCKQTVEKIGLRQRLHGEAMRVVGHAKERGIDVYLVSASPLGIVAAAADIVGIPLPHVTAVREEISPAGIVECRVVRPIPYGEGKVTNLRRLIGPGRPLYAAFGDNAFDVPLLGSAGIPVAIRPKQRLLDRAHEIPTLRILERI